MIARLALLFVLTCGNAVAQSRDVDPRDLGLRVVIENGDVVPYQQEMVLITIHGVYRRHITNEKLEQPDFDGFNWMQLGQDDWFESRVDGRSVKNFRRRMAVFPERPGTLRIGAFVHHLTLTDENDDWFPHDVRSDPFTIEVAPAPEVKGWWFPTRRLEISDRWSNPPDQLGEGEGVLRVIQLRAVGAAPEMLPPMPELKSPSAMIFAHPEKRLVELSPEGPVAHAYWRWTIRPTNATSAIVEPIELEYFDTANRQSHDVTISAQRIAMAVSDATPQQEPAESAVLHPGAIVAGAGIAFLAGLLILLQGRRIDAMGGLARMPLFDPYRRLLWRAANRGDPGALRRAAVAMLRRDGSDPARRRLLAEFDVALFDSSDKTPDLRRFARQFAGKGAESVRRST